MTWKWTTRGYTLYNKQKYHLAEQCATLAIHFKALIPLVSGMARAQPYLCRALTRYELGNVTGAQTDISEIKRLDRDLARVNKYICNIRACIHDNLFEAFLRTIITP